MEGQHAVALCRDLGGGLRRAFGEAVPGDQLLGEVAAERILAGGRIARGTCVLCFIVTPRMRNKA